jgi:hypothetical protein
MDSYYFKAVLEDVDRTSTLPFRCVNIIQNYIINDLVVSVGMGKKSKEAFAFIINIPCDCQLNFRL